MPIGARSRVRREDMRDGSAAEGGGAHRLDGERCVEEPLARPARPIEVEGVAVCTRRPTRIVGDRLATVMNTGVCDSCQTHVRFGDTPSITRAREEWSGRTFTRTGR